MNETINLLIDNLLDKINNNFYFEKYKKNILN